MDPISWQLGYDDGRAGRVWHPVGAQYPNEFIGRCQTCLGNANLSAEPCRVGFGQGQPVVDSDCMIRRARAAYDKERKNDRLAYASGYIEGKAARGYRSLVKDASATKGEPNELCSTRDRQDKRGATKHPK